AALSRLRADPAALRPAGLALRAASAGERTLTGEAATDEGVGEVTPLGCAGDSALALVRTDCGNVALIAFAGGDGAWTPAAGLAVVDSGRPGRCVRSVAGVAPVALTSAEAREFAVETEVTSDDGDDGSGRTLRVALLGPGGALRWYAGQVALGSFDEASGAATQGRWDIIEELPLPRDLYVEQRPLHGGLAGQPIGQEIRRETWRVRDLALVRVDVSRERVLPPAPPPSRPSD
ncbi:MAG: hypothetical protein Q8S73_39755, partial [Deltaproteobacteria bacterium]|nr:hypothetical protein [Deltaproteobacteria bacterium]